MYRSQQLRTGLEKLQELVNTTNSMGDDVGRIAKRDEIAKCLSHLEKAADYDPDNVTVRRAQADIKAIHPV